MNRTFEKHDDDIVIVAGARTAIGRFGGSLKDVSAIDLGATVVAEAVERAGIDPAEVDELVVGQVGGWGPNGFVARACLTRPAPTRSTASAAAASRPSWRP